MSFAVGMSESMAFVQAWRSGVLRSRARPEDALPLLNLLPRDAVVIGDAALRGQAKLFENIARRFVAEFVAGAQSACEVDDDLPVFSCVKRRIDRLSVKDDPPLHVGGRSLILLHEGAGQ